MFSLFPSVFLKHQFSDSIACLPAIHEIVSGFLQCTHLRIYRSGTYCNTISDSTKILFQHQSYGRFLCLPHFGFKAMSSIAAFLLTGNYSRHKKCNKTGTDLGKRSAIDFSNTSISLLGKLFPEIGHTSEGAALLQRGNVIL